MSAPGQRFAPGELFTPLALALAPRVLLVDPGAAARVRVAWRPAALDPAQRAALEGLADASARMRGEFRLHPDEVLLDGELAELERRAPSLPAAAALLAAVRAQALPARAPRLAGILNVTPDSFSDGGRFLDPSAAVERALALIAEGAEWIDVGGESTRPGAQAVPAAEERRRVVAVIAALARRASVTISIDTTKAEVAEAALDAGADVVNDVSAGRFDPAMLPLVARRGCGYVLMHMLGTPRDMQRDPRYDEVVADVLAFLRERAAAALAAGVGAERLWIDPGIGFGKTLEHNLELLRRLRELRSLGLPLLLGVSRKSFIGRINEAAGRGAEPPAQRLGGSAAALAACVWGGAEVLRVHDVAPMAEAARVAWALRP